MYLQYTECCTILSHAFLVPEYSSTGTRQGCYCMHKILGHTDDDACHDPSALLPIYHYDVAGLTCMYSMNE